jgi:hypothetical protein
MESGHLCKANQGWYNVVDQNTGEVIEPKRRAKDIEKDDEFFEGLIECPKFKAFIERRFKLNNLEKDDVNVREDDLIESDTE